MDTSSLWPFSASLLKAWFATHQEDKAKHVQNIAMPINVGHAVLWTSERVGRLFYLVPDRKPLIFKKSGHL